jgi:hypothetical protein
MESLRRFGYREVALAGVLLTLAFPAAAYVDPGSGMLLWQGMIASIGVMLALVRQPIATVKRWVRRITGK